MCLYLLENPRKKESVVSELARDCVSKFLLVGSNMMLVVYDNFGKIVLLGLSLINYKL